YRVWLFAGTAGSAEGCDAKSLLGQLTQFIKRIHGPPFDGRQARHGNQPAKILQGAFVFYLQQQILAALVVEDDRLLRRLVDVHRLVPSEDKTAVRNRGGHRQQYAEWNENSGLPPPHKPVWLRLTSTAVFELHTDLVHSAK